MCGALCDLHTPLRKRAGVDKTGQEVDNSGQVEHMSVS